MKIYLSHSGNYDYEAELYRPLKLSVLAKKYQILFPHDKENADVNSKDFIQHADLVIADVSYPSTGQGIELGWADDSGIPIVCVHKTGSRPSSSLRFIASEHIEYLDTDDMLQKLGDWLAAK